MVRVPDGGLTLLDCAMPGRLVSMAEAHSWEVHSWVHGWTTQFGVFQAILAFQMVSVAFALHTLAPRQNQRTKWRT